MFVDGSEKISEPSSYLRPVMKTDFLLRIPSEPLPPPVKEPPPDAPENPDIPVREPDPDEPTQI
jgi:hypothetical protein